MLQGKKYSFPARKAFQLFIRWMGTSLVIPILFFYRIFLPKHPSPREKIWRKRDLFGIIGLILTIILLFILAGGWQLISIIVIHTWAMLLFVQTESFLKIFFRRIWRQLLFTIQLAFLVLLCLIDYEISLNILAVFLIIAKLSGLIVHESIWLYTHFLGRDRFEARYWWKRVKNPKRWEAIFPKLIKRRYLKSVSEILRLFLQSPANRQLKFARLALASWIQLRRYQILPDDLVLAPQPAHKKVGPRLQMPHIINTACHFELMQYWIEQAQRKQRYQELLDTYLLHFQTLLEQYIQQPSAVAIQCFQEEYFVTALDAFLEEVPRVIQHPALLEKIRYNYGLLYVAKGIADNLK